MPRRQKAAIIHEPPHRDVTFPRGVQIIRYQANGQVSNQIVTRAAMLSMVLQGRNATSTQSRLFEACRLIKVEAWSPPTLPGLSGGDNSLSLDFGDVESGFRVQNDVGLGSNPGYVSIRTRPTSDAYVWSQQAVNESEVLFRIDCPGQTVIDVHFECTIASNFNTPLAGWVTTAAGTQYENYFNCLDGTVGNIVPVGNLNSIV
jgi:hypothetical protein